ncbi:MAG: DUF3043 domain-containing protein [Gordonia sp. (in: high G+C Gram-positive bacteria)]
MPWNSGSDAADDGPQTTVDDAIAADTADDQRSGTTAGKGRPTPKRRDAQNRRPGPVAPPPTNRSEARARRKSQKQTLTKEERKELKSQRSQQRTEQREKMMAGDEKYMIAKDRGPVRAFARDLVDSRRNVAGLFLPFAVVLLVAMMMPQYAFFINILLLAFVIVVVVDSIILGRMVNNRVRERFPETTDTGFRLGFYSFVRAMQLRMMRAPRPQVSSGDKV